MNKYHAYVYVHGDEEISVLEDYGVLNLAEAMRKCDKYIRNNFLFPRAMSKHGDDLIATDDCSYGAVVVIEKVK